MKSSLRTFRLTPASRRRDGKVLVMMAILAPLVLLPFTALAMDLAYLRALKKELQNTADACALAGAMFLPSENAARTAALPYGGKNMPAGAHGDVLVVSDIEIGNWDFTDRTFRSHDDDELLPINAVKVTTRRANRNDNPAPLYFAQVFGRDEQDVIAEAVAVRSVVAGNLTNGKSRFMIDSEMIDSDEQAIEELAASLGKPPEDIISDLDGDWFIDLPPGAKLWLPTGQLQDEALFEMGPEFPFTDTSDPSHVDFLNYNEDSSSWRYDLIPKSMLDPLLGVSPFNDANLYPTLVDPDYVHVSPVFKSDVSVLNPVTVSGALGDIPAVNALGWRRGLLAYKIIDWSWHPDGYEEAVPSYLPYLQIEVVNPALVDANFDANPTYDFSSNPIKVRLVW